VPNSGVGGVVEAPVQLDEHQQRAVDRVTRGHNVFITGGAGVGKSTVTQSILDVLRRKYGNDYNHKVGVTASTGMASVQVGGCTLHHLSGVGVPSLTDDFKKIRRAPYKEIWAGFDVLVIDEISMISGEFMDRLDEQVKKVRNSNKPFGGLQVVLVGDPFQLPPIGAIMPPETCAKLMLDKLCENKAEIEIKKRTRRELFLNRGSIFESSFYWDMDFQVTELEVPHRQSTAMEYYRHLKNLRVGQDAINLCRFFNQIVPVKQRGANIVSLYPTRQQMHEENDARLDMLPGKAKVYEAEDVVWADESACKDPPLFKNGTAVHETKYRQLLEYQMRFCGFFGDTDEKHSVCQVPDKVKLKKGARVILIKNIDSVLVNGLAGTVVALGPNGKTWASVMFDGMPGETILTPVEFRYSIPGVGTCQRKQLPLQLGWALTHHKAQGKTLDAVRVNPASFAHGQAYVALSRTRQPEHIELLEPMYPKDMTVDDVSIKFWNNLNNTNSEEVRKLFGTWQDISVFDHMDVYSKVILKKQIRKIEAGASPQYTAYIMAEHTKRSRGKKKKKASPATAELHEI
jgi:ATP-dependent DNA helicase PIF1